MSYSSLWIGVLKDMLDKTVFADVWPQDAIIRKYFHNKYHRTLVITKLESNLQKVEFLRY